jgi:hypothetical protein
MANLFRAFWLLQRSHPRNGSLTPCHKGRGLVSPPCQARCVPSDGVPRCDTSLGGSTQRPGEHSARIRLAAIYAQPRRRPGHHGDRGGVGGRGRLRRARLERPSEPPHGTCIAQNALELARGRIEFDSSPDANLELAQRQKPRPGGERKPCWSPRLFKPARGETFVQRGHLLAKSRENRGSTGLP